MPAHHLAAREIGAALIVAGILQYVGIIPSLNAMFGIPPGLLISLAGIILFVFGLKGSRRAASPIGYYILLLGLVAIILYVSVTTQPFSGTSSAQVCTSCVIPPLNWTVIALVAGIGLVGFLLIRRGR